MSTFGTAAVLFPEHRGIVFCHHARFPRTRPGLARLREALAGLAEHPPPGIGAEPVAGNGSLGAADSEAAGLQNAAMGVHWPHVLVPTGCTGEPR